MLCLEYDTIIKMRNLVTKIFPEDGNKFSVLKLFHVYNITQWTTSRNPVKMIEGTELRHRCHLV